uniref:Secreted protein n=1 Tax=Spongospora subterranea TaxID=70186 RepID=A0A0H5QGG9_9EUKA|eukprot:CRZ01050.1 hypothetical protein [Spongospora subterranea]
MSMTLYIVAIVALLIQFNGAVTDCEISNEITECSPERPTQKDDSLQRLRQSLKLDEPRNQFSYSNEAGQKLEKTSESEKPKHIVYSQKTTCGAAIKRCICGD